MLKPASAEAPPRLKTIDELVDEQNLTHSGIGGKLHLNYRTLKHRLESPWLFNVVELNKLAKLLKYAPADLFALVTALAVTKGEFDPDKAPVTRRAGRPRQVDTGPPTGE